MTQAGMIPFMMRNLVANPVYLPPLHRYVCRVTGVVLSTDWVFAHQAWNDANLIRLAEKIKSPLVL